MLPDQATGGAPQESEESQPSSAPVPWPSLRDSLNDLPEPLRRRFEGQRQEQTSRDPEGNANIGIVEMRNDESKRLCPIPPMGLRKDEVTFMAHRQGENSKLEGKQDEAEEERRGDKTLDYEREDARMRNLIDEARAAEGGKYICYSAAVPLSKEDADALIRQGHTVIPSKWVVVDKAAHKSHERHYQPKVKSRLVSCGNFEDQGSLRLDAPTSDMETHHVVAAWSASHGLQLHSADITSAYFQATPLDRVVLMRQPRAGLPGVDPSVVLLVRVPVYGLCDSGRGFWKSVPSILFLEATCKGLRFQGRR